VLLGVPDEISEYRPRLLYAQLTHPSKIHEVKDTKG
jgi:hypothetical protein